MHSVVLASQKANPNFFSRRGRKSKGRCDDCFVSPGSFSTTRHLLRVCVLTECSVGLSGPQTVSPCPVCHQGQFCRQLVVVGSAPMGWHCSSTVWDPSNAGSLWKGHTSQCQWEMLLRNSNSISCCKTAVGEEKAARRPHCDT